VLHRPEYAIKQDPDIVLDGAARTVAIIEQIAKESPPTGDLDKKHKDDVARLQPVDARATHRYW